jgi:hypothetical protein
MMTYPKIRSILIIVLLLISLSFASKKYVIDFDSLNVSFFTNKGTMNVNVLFTKSLLGNIYELGHISEILLDYDNKKLQISSDSLFQKTWIKGIQLYENKTNFFLCFFTTRNQFVIITFSKALTEVKKIELRDEDLFAKQKKKKISSIKASFFLTPAMRKIKMDAIISSEKEFLIRFDENDFYQVINQKKLSNFKDLSSTSFRINAGSDSFSNAHYVFVFDHYIIRMSINGTMFKVVYP